MDDRHMESPERNAERRGHMLMVIPSNLEVHNGEIILDGDFAQYLRLYLDAFETVTVACPAASAGSFPTLEPLATVPHDGRLKVIVLPEPYREDRYLFARRRVTRLLKKEINLADFVVVAPHSAFDWPTLAADLCMDIGKPYNMEGDWNLQQVNWSTWRKLSFGINKLRRWLWMKHHDPRYYRAMRNSSVALLHGHDVFEAYKDIAPHPQVVNNFRITPEDRIASDALSAKRASVLGENKLRILYAGRAIQMKGPIEWLTTLRRLRELGVKYDATWFGDGDMVPAMREFVDANAMNDDVTIAGRVERSDIFSALFKADIFMFCHLTRESPRNLVESLAAGTPIIGFGSPYSDHLVEQYGGGEFVATGDVEGLANAIARLNLDRPGLASLIGNAARSGQQFDRKAAVSRRIRLMKEYCLPDV